MELVKIDRHGRFYLRKEIRKAAGIDDETVLEVTASEGKIVLTPRKESIAKASRGIFKINRHIDDVDKEIEEKSLKKILGELDDLRRC